MIFFVAADEGDPSEEAQKEKALLDTEELRESDAEGATDKVELDLDDAPFLDEQEEEEEEEPGAPVDDAGLIEAPSAPKEGGWQEKLRELLKDKRVQIGGGGGLLLLIVLLVLLFLPSSEPEPEPPKPEETKTVEPPKEEPAKPVVEWKPFWVETKGEDGEIRFLFLKFSTPVKDDKMAWSVKHKMLILRDAVFYYLRNKNYVFLSDKKNVEEFKADLLSVINQHMEFDKVEEILIEEYLVK